MGIYSAIGRYTAMPPRDYVLILAGSVVLFALVVPAMMVAFLSPYLEGRFLWALMLLPVSCLFVVAFYPLRGELTFKREVEQKLPLFITHMTALASSGMSAKELLSKLSAIADYGDLSRDAGRIVRLIDDYRIGVSDACRLVAQNVRSEAESEFLQRLAHAVDVGESIEAFLTAEQEVVMEKYVLNCETAFKNLDYVRDMFIALVTGIVFMAVFIALVPMVTNQSPELMIGAVAVAFVCLEIPFLIIIKYFVPRDQIWFSWKHKRAQGMLTEADREHIRALLIGAAGSVLVALIVLPLPTDLALKLALIPVPLIMPSYFVLLEERKVVGRDALFESFIRALGESEGAGGRSISDSVRDLSLHRYGDLTENIRRLSQRLDTGIDQHASWQRFSAENDSNLIRMFSDMYVDSINNGASAERSGRYISRNLLRFIAMRAKRLTLASSFVGVLYGLILAISVTLWISIGIFSYMGSLGGELSSGSDALYGVQWFSQMLQTAEHSGGLLALLIIAMIVVHAVVSSVMLSELRGGSRACIGLHASGMIIVGCGVKLIVEAFMDIFLLGGG